jgi:Lytic transglycolase
MRRWHLAVLVTATVFVDVAAATTRPETTFLDRWFGGLNSRASVTRQHHAWSHRHHLHTRTARIHFHTRVAERVIHHARIHSARRFSPHEDLRSARQLPATDQVLTAPESTELAPELRTRPEPQLGRRRSVRPAWTESPTAPEFRSDADELGDQLSQLDGGEPATAPRARQTTGCGQIAKVSYYWESRRTATGEAFRPDGLTAAHRTLPFGTRLTVMNPRTGQSVTVVINDRGPYVRGVSLDLSRGAARAIGMRGTEHICVSGAAV